MKKGDYVDLVLMRGEEGEPILGIAPRFTHLEPGDTVEIVVNNEKHTVTVEANRTVTFGEEDYTFAAKCFGDDPERVRVTAKLVVRELKWEEES